eukprot:TRINITY_DN27221_c0_g2_i1.p1 TRINITY_DN27221_c0_g2~~TRINITY_DN27221_c0_g2_i1.p1  ORF type:complete len:782 (+),score=174.18 TRINITY_DN27221_c0_g2_i1:60-2405(+)
MLPVAAGVSSSALQDGSNPGVGFCVSLDECQGCGNFGQAGGAAWDRAGGTLSVQTPFPAQLPFMPTIKLIITIFLLLGCVMVCFSAVLSAVVTGKRASRRSLHSWNVARRWVKDLLEIFVSFPLQGARFCLHWLVVVPFQLLQSAGLAIDTARKARLQQQLLDEAYAIAARSSRQKSGDGSCRRGSALKNDQRHARAEGSAQCGTAGNAAGKKRDRDKRKDQRDSRFPRSPAKVAVVSSLPVPPSSSQSAQGSTEQVEEVGDGEHLEHCGHPPSQQQHEAGAAERQPVLQFHTEPESETQTADKRELQSFPQQSEPDAVERQESHQLSTEPQSAEHRAQEPSQEQRESDVALQTEPQAGNQRSTHPAQQPSRPQRKPDAFESQPPSQLRAEAQPATQPAKHQAQQPSLKQRESDAVKIQPPQTSQTEPQAATQPVEHPAKQPSREQREIEVAKKQLPLQLRTELQPVKHAVQQPFQEPAHVTVEWQQVQREAHGRNKPKKDKQTSKEPLQPPASRVEPVKRVARIHQKAAPRQEPSLGAEVATAASPQRNPWEKFSDRLVAKGCILPVADSQIEEKKDLAPAERQADFGEAIDQELLSWPASSPSTEHATKLSSEECSTDTSEADDFFKSFIRNAQAKEYEANLCMPYSSSLPPHLSTGMQDPPLPGLASLGTFCNWGMGGTGDTADVDMDMGVAEDEVDLRLEAMVEDLAGAESFTWRDRRQLVEDAFTKVDAARTALSKVLTCGQLRHSAKAFVPGQMWMGSDEGGSSFHGDADANVPR